MIDLNAFDKVMLLGDSEGNTEFVVNAIKYAVQNSDTHLILQLGDFRIWDHVQTGIRFLDAVNNVLEEYDTWIIFADGNHENFDSLYSYPFCEDGFRYVRSRILHSPRGNIFSVSGTHILSMGGAHSIDGPNGIWQQSRGPKEVSRIEDDPVDLGHWWPQEAITTDEVYDALENINNFNGKIDVVIAHDCPAGVQIPGIHGYPASDRNRHLLAQVCKAADPRWIFCGHYHRRHSGRFKNSQVEILAADINRNAEQALIFNVEDLKRV